MSTLIIGAHGSMGQRYQAILKYHLRKPFDCVDKELTGVKLLDRAQHYESFIVATPTETHAQIVSDLAIFGKPILCEKPVVKDAQEMDELILTLRRHKTPFRMMYQYSLLARENSIGSSYYKYFRHGSDGLVWDCMQIIALARGQCELSEDSAIWMCKINGRKISIYDMDSAYIGYVHKWFTEPAMDLGYLKAIHEKVREAAKRAPGA